MIVKPEVMFTVYGQNGNPFTVKASGPVMMHSVAKDDDGDRFRDEELLVPGVRLRWFEEDDQDHREVYVELDDLTELAGVMRGRWGRAKARREIALLPEAELAV